MSMTPHKRLLKARTALILDHPFFGMLAMRLQVEEREGVPTMATDGISLLYNPEFVQTLTEAELLGVVAHEVMHCALGHTWRGEGKLAMKWNIAADIKANETILEAGFTLPKGAIVDKEYKADSVEQVYSKIPDPPKRGKGEGGKGKGGKGGKGGGQPNMGNDPGGCGEVLVPKDSNKRKELGQEWKAAVVQAAQAAKAGNLPASINRLVDSIVDPEVPWESILRDFVERSAKNDYCWTVPNRRHLQRGFVLPSLLSDELPEIVIVNDTSGSRSQTHMNQFCAEASAILEAYNTTIRVIHCDCDVANTETFTRDDLPLKMKPSGGGGTDFRPPFKWLEKHNIQPACLIYFTDLECHQYPDEPNFPVIWLTDAPESSRYKAPFGETLRFRGR